MAHLVLTRQYPLSKCLNRLGPTLAWFSQASSSNEVLRKSVLNDFHMSHGGKMVPFAGWSMPVVYDLSITDSALHTRQSASLFDVSHMLQTEVSGTDADKFLETVAPIDTQNLSEGSGSLSVLTNDQGGIVDDCIITRIGSQSFYVVSNAACAEKDIKHLNGQLEDKFSGKDVQITILEDRSLLALQGPRMQELLSQGVRDDISKLYFMHSTIMDVFGVPDCRVTRCGYTGEDGVEISVPSSQAEQLAAKLLEFDDIKLAGLGARDILRLEAGLCLYGNDLTDETTPIEAGLAWCISARRRKEGGFNGSQVILDQIKNKPDKRRVGLVSENRRPVREGAIVLDTSGSTIGTVTSGGPSPTVGAYVAMAYVPRRLSKTGTELQIQIKNKLLPTKIVKLPFVPSNYYTAPK